MMGVEVRVGGWYRMLVVCCSIDMSQCDPGYGSPSLHCLRSANLAVCSRPVLVDRMICLE